MTCVFFFAGACLKSCTRCCVSCGRASGRWSARTKCLTPSGKWFHSSRVTRSKTLRNFSGKLVHTKYFLCFIRWHTKVGILLSILDTHVILCVCAFALASDYRTILPVSQWCYSYNHVCRWFWKLCFQRIFGQAIIRIFTSVVTIIFIFRFVVQSCGYRVVIILLSHVIDVLVIGR